MSNKPIGHTNVKQRLICLNDSDWYYLNKLSTEYKLKGASAVIRLFLRLLEENPLIIKPLLKQTRKDNRMIEAISKKQNILEKLLEAAKENKGDLNG